MVDLAEEDHIMYEVVMEHQAKEITVLQEKLVEVAEEAQEAVAE
jgi:hypothetical protein